MIGFGLKGRFGLLFLCAAVTIVGTFETCRLPLRMSGYRGGPGNGLRTVKTARLDPEQTVGRAGCPLRAVFSCWAVSVQCGVTFDAR